MKILNTKAKALWGQEVLKEIKEILEEFKKLDAQNAKPLFYSKKLSSSSILPETL